MTIIIKAKADPNVTPRSAMTIIIKAKADPNVTLILDRDGKVREFYFGAHDYAFFESRARHLLHASPIEAAPG
jgi:hypothetical protein